MLVVLTILSFLFSSGICDKLTPYQYPSPNPKLTACVGAIIRQYFFDAHKLSYYNFDLEDDKLLQAINSLEMLTVSIRFPTRNVTRDNRAYMIVAKNEKEFTQRVMSISSEVNWNPKVRFLIVINKLQEVELEKVFNSLLQLHIFNVIVVNGTETAEIYTYDPFENYACGKYYSRITKFGKCSHVVSIDLYPKKMVTGLRNCFFNVSCPHWPPYSIDPSKSKHKPFVMGTEQYIFHLIGQVEHFKYKFNYNYDPEMFSTVSQDMTVSGPMTMLQTNRTDVMLGGLILTQSRGKMFFYVNGHLDQVDEIKIIVKRASETPPWKNFYLEFSPLVWSLLLLVLVVYSFLVMTLLKTRDKGHVVLVLLDHLFLHGAKSYIHARHIVKIVFIYWVWFAYLINSFYQSSLVSLTTKPSLEYQIHNTQGIYAHGLKACVSLVMKTFMNGELNGANNFQNYLDDQSCERLMQSIRTVSQSNDRFTIAPYIVYLYHKQKTYDIYGKSQVYPFRQPFHKLIYGMYFYKGFPMGERLHVIALRIRETGLSEKSLNDHYFLRALKYHFHSQKIIRRFSIPWRVYITGVFISSLAFLVEIMSTHKSSA